MKLRGTLLAATVLALPLAANAQPVTGLYIGLGAGVNLMQDVTAGPVVAGGTAVAGTSGHMSSHLGPVVVGSVGWGFGNGLRAEIEANYRYNPFDNSGSGFGAGVSTGGKEQKFGGMVNVLYDFVGLTPWLQPYVGVGVGYEAAYEQDLHMFAPGGTFRASDKTKGSLAYQAILGAAVPIEAVPGLALTAEYRFMGLTGDRSYSGTAVNATGSTGASVKLKDDFNHSFLIGVRYNFGQAPAPMAAPVAAPAPAVQPARSYLVFFDWDKATLTDRARQIVKEAADNSTRVQYTRIEVNGYTDTSGTPQYNQRLSVRRAQAVAAELVADGVPRNAISIQGFGETHLLVPTGPNVREPQNRRVEIIIR